MFHHNRQRKNRSSRNFNSNRKSHMPSYGYNSLPKGSYPFYDYQQWKQHMTRIQQQQQHQQQRPKSSFYFQDQSTFYYMSDPIYTADNRIIIQMTKVHISLNGDQQRVFVEQEFSNENQLKQFVKNLHANFYKTFDKSNVDEQKPTVFVVEEPDEEPKIYQQDENDHSQRLSIKSSCSTIYSSKRQKQQMKFPKENHSHPHTQFQKCYGHLPRQRFNRPKDQQKPSSYPRTFGANLIFSTNKPYQPRLNQSKSNCQMPPYYQTPMTYYRLFQHY